MSKLRSAESYMKQWGCSGKPSEWPGILREIHEEVVQACADAFRLAASERGFRAHDGLVEFGIDTILAVAKPPETDRDRLGRVLWEATCPGGKLSDLTPLEIKLFCDRAAAVIAEQRNMEAEHE